MRLDVVENENKYRHLPFVKAYVDGTFYEGKYGGGFVIIDPDEKILFQDCGIGSDNPELLALRNIAGEMSAAMRATLWIDYYVGRGVIVHDYTGLSKWVTGEWNTNNPYTRLYADFMKPFYTLDIISFEWVKGHTDNRGNEIADRLARQSVVHNEQWQF